MIWYLKVTGGNAGKSMSSVLVEAEDWYTALKNGLDRQGLKLGPISKLSCSIHNGGEFAVLDRDADLIYELLPSAPRSLHETPTIPPPKFVKPATDEAMLTTAEHAERVILEDANIWTLERGKKELCKISLVKVPQDSLQGTGGAKPLTRKG